MLYRNKRSAYGNFILIFVAIKVVLNLLAISNFGFHRDELLHLTLGDHLGWGYKEVPPFIGLLAKISMGLFGESVFAARVFTTVASGIIVWLTGLITLELGGKKFAITMACLAVIFSPAFAASGYLFQPVVFDQLWWVLTVWLVIRYVNTSSVIYLYATGAVTGLGMLTKYSMAFFAIALLAGILISKQRKLLLNVHILGALGVALLFLLPNFIWQWQNHFPVVNHMQELKSSQLDYIKPLDFIMKQLLVHGIALFIWITGLIFLLFSFKLRKFQFLAIAYLLIFIFMLKMNGKSYYLFGAYPMLFAAGGYGLHRLLKTTTMGVRIAVVALFTLPNLYFLPLVLPILPLNKTLQVFDFTRKNLQFFNFATKWEDQQQHRTTQDYGDMFGWDEMTALTAKAYYSIKPEYRENTYIFAQNYGQAGALHVLGKQYKLPEVICLNSSFALWAPDDMQGSHLIYVTENELDITELAPYINGYKLIGKVQNQLAREKGACVYLLVNPAPVLNLRYKKDLAEIRSRGNN